MRYYRELHHRRSIRIKGYDYSRPGSYFVTLCTQDRECWFGEVIYGTVQLSPIGKAVHEGWLRIPSFFPNVVLDEFVVMPNHVHGIITMIDSDSVHAGPGVGLVTGRGLVGRGLINQTPTISTRDANATKNTNTDGEWILMRNPKQTLGKIIRHYKAGASKLIRDGGHSHFQWQPNYYEHIIRNETDLNKIRKYIVENPMKWAEDAENPKRER
jgi:putative transposase